MLEAWGTNITSTCMYQDGRLEPLRFHLGTPYLDTTQSVPFSLVGYANEGMTPGESELLVGYYSYEGNVWGWVKGGNLVRMRRRVKYSWGKEAQTSERGKKGTPILLNKTALLHSRHVCFGTPTMKRMGDIHARASQPSEEPVRFQPETSRNRSQPADQTTPALSHPPPAAGATNVPSCRRAVTLTAMTIPLAEDASEV